MLRNILFNSGDKVLLYYGQKQQFNQHLAVL